MIRGLVRSYPALAAIASYRIVAFADAANTSSVAAATGPNAPLIGTTGKVGASAPGAMVDVELTDLPRVQLGGPVSAGDQLTSDANGQAVKVSAVGQRVLGIADQPGVAGDIVNYLAGLCTAGGV